MMLNQFHVLSNNRGSLNKRVQAFQRVNQKHFIIVQSWTHSNYLLIIVVRLIEVNVFFYNKQSNDYILMIDTRATCLARFTDGNINYIVARSEDRARFVCFVSIVVCVQRNARIKIEAMNSFSVSIF